MGAVTVSAFRNWVMATESAGGVAVVWPFQNGLYGQYFGQPAARFAAAAYASAGNSGGFDVSAPQQGTANNQWFYVLAPAAAIADAPHTMTLAERVANAVYTTGDRVADTLGLPSLAGLEETLLIIAGVVGLFFAMEIIKRVPGFRSVQ